MEFSNGRTARSAGARSVLVTGGAGYIGSLLVRRLLNEGYFVRVLDSLLYGGDAIDELRASPGFELVVGDFRVPYVVSAALKDVDAVVHLGAIVGDPACSLDEHFTIDTNFGATKTLVQACKRAGVRRFVFASTCSVYGASDGELDETSALNPVSLYANTKIASERYLRSEFDESFAPVILRFGTAFGMSPRPRFDLVINLLTAKAVVDGVITIHGGDQWRPFIHADDIGKAIEGVLRVPLDEVGGEVFNVGVTGMNFKIGEVGQLIQEAVPTAQVEINDEVIDQRNYYVNFGKIQRRIGFEPDQEMRSSVLRMADVARAIGDYHQPRYNNYLSMLHSDAARQTIAPSNGAAPPDFATALAGAGRFDGK